MRDGFAGRVAGFAVLISMLGAGTAQAAPTAGALRPLASGGCIIDGAATSACAAGRGLSELYSELAISPDDAFVYTAARASNAVATFSVNALTGAPTQLVGQAGCVHDDGTAATADCGAAKGLNGANSVVVSPDGNHLYVASGNDDAVTTFLRNKDTGTFGFVSCVSSDTAASGCSVTGNRMDGVLEVAISPDGTNAYAAAVGSSDNGSLLVFDRDVATGALTQKGPGLGCLAATGSPPRSPSPTAA